MDLVLAWVREAPGETAGRYGELTGLGHIKAQRRLSDLKTQGLIYQEGRALWQGTR